MINVNLCKIEDTGKFINLVISGSGSTTPTFNKVILYTSATYGKEALGYDVSNLLNPLTSSQSLMINLMSLGLVGALDLFIIEISTTDGMKAKAIAGNFTDIRLGNIERVSQLVLNNNCQLVSKDGSDCCVEEAMYVQLILSQLHHAANTNQYNTLVSMVQSIKNIINVPCEVFYPEFSIFTENNNVTPYV